MKLKRWMTLALSGVLAAGTLGYASVPAKADVAYSTEYEITIPSTLEVQNAGWNATTGITAKLGSGEAFDSSKKLTVTAASAHSWTLVSDNNTVGYNLATEGNNDSVYNTQAEVPSWEFAADEITTEGKNKAMGIIVEDYSEKPAGTYQDTVTFTAKVEDSKPEYYNKLTSGAGKVTDQIRLLKDFGRGRRAYNSSLTAAQAYALATYQAAIDGKPVYVIMSSQDDGYEIHYSVSTDTAATEHSSRLYDLLGGDPESAGLNLYYVAQ